MTLCQRTMKLMQRPRLQCHPRRRPGTHDLQCCGGRVVGHRPSLAPRNPCGTAAKAGEGGGRRGSGDDTPTAVGQFQRRLALPRRLTWPMFLLGFLACLFAGTAFAQQPTQAQAAAIKQSCRSDYQSHCSSVPPGGSAALQCLEQHQSSLSPPCQTALAAVSGGASHAPPANGTSPGAPPGAPPPAMSPRQQAAMMRHACGGDFRAYCHGVGLGGGRAMACLAENEPRLSPPCRSALAEARGSR